MPSAPVIEMSTRDRRTRRSSTRLRNPSRSEPPMPAPSAPGAAAGVPRSCSTMAAETRNDKALMARRRGGADQDEQPAPDHVADHDRGLHRDARQGEGVAVLLLGHEVGHGGRAGRLEGRGGQAGQEGQHEHRPHRQPRDEHEPEHGGPDEVGAEHDRDATPAVGQGGQDLAEADVARQGHRGDAGRPGRRAGALEHDDGEGEPTGPVAEEGDDVGDPEAPEVADAQRRQQCGRPTPEPSAFALHGEHGTTT